MTEMQCCNLQEHGFAGVYFPGTVAGEKAVIAAGGASHALADGLDEMTGYAKWALNHMLPAEKKYPKECEEARQDSFRRILRFLGEWEINRN